MTSNPKERRTVGRTWGFFQEKLIQEGGEYKWAFIVEWPEKALDELMIPEAGKRTRWLKPPKQVWAALGRASKGEMHGYRTECRRHRSEDVSQQQTPSESSRSMQRTLHSTSA